MNTRRLKNTALNKILGITLSIALILPLSACGQSSTSSNSSDTTNAAGGTETAESSEGKNTATELHVAYQPIVGFIPVFILKDEQLLENAFKEKGYDVKITYTEFESGPPENEAFASGQEDVGVMGDVPALSGIAAGQKRSLIGLAYDGESMHSILVKKDSDIKEVSDLKGKKVGTVIGSSGHCALNNILKASGLSLSDVEIVNISPGEMEGSLENGNLDAVSVWEPTPSKIVYDNVGEVLADGTGVYAYSSPIIVNTDYLNQNPEIIKIFLEQYKIAAEELQNDTDKYVSQYADSFGLSEDVLKTAISKAGFPIDISYDNADQLQGTADFLIDNELVTNKINVKDYIVPDIK